MQVRTGFLYNHDQIHQIAHSLPIALALARRGNEVVLAATSQTILDEIARLAGVDALALFSIVRLDMVSRRSRFTEATLGWVLPARKLLVYRDNLDFFRSLDLLVVTERTSLLLKTRYRIKGLKIVLADHGAGDRAIGFGASAAQFDHILAAGPKIRDRLIADAGVDPARISVTGYPKFDLAGGNAARLPMQTNGRTTILYNPHPSPHLSSWYDMGRGVLDYFLASDRYNLIFAPHVMLFHRRFVATVDRLRIDRPGTVQAHYRNAPHIHVDLGSAASTDMTYTNAADIYLGDVSSQIYEFLLTPRPCLFLNAQGTDHAGDPNYAHWQSGPVIETLDRLDSALAETMAQHEGRYRAAQQRLFDYTFDRSDTPSAERAAQVLCKLGVA